MTADAEPSATRARPAYDTMPAARRGDRGHRPHRPWSERRIPAAVAAVLLLAAAGSTLYDVLAVRAGRRAAVWRRQLANELSSRHVDDVWMLTGAAVVIAIGLWLLILAFTPGPRNLLPLRPPNNSPPHLQATLDRHSAALLLRDAAMMVPGVGKVRVQVRRGRIKATADVHFRDPHQVRDDLTAALQKECDELALTHPPRLAVHVRRRTA
ncbi:hypothetical protein SRB17_88460 [Streptomyces sp. RB17]|uniref:DUF6286 domain-containing protein n=1 Tax=Streptomyces sp. RB17 TaxID=2585197 RepID=UPI00130788FE|nr:DUF6286 domain-containing protein [Streptomyces sp. RB17]MQY40813.1 hypothetical protein [Streptomyces sp. RB17]